MGYDAAYVDQNQNWLDLSHETARAVPGIPPNNTKENNINSL